MNMENLPPQTQEIVAALSATDSETIRDAAFKAGDTGLEEAAPQLCGLLKSPSAGVQEAAEYALRKIRGPHVVAALLPLLRSDEAPARNVAMDILREIGVDSIESMRPYLMDEDADLRIFITDILGYCRTRQASLLLGRALLRDPESNVRHQAAVSLGNLAFPEDAGVLVQAMHDEEWVQFAVVEALAKIRNHAAVSGLIRFLPQASPLVGSVIVDALGDMGDVKSIPLLFSSLENINVSLRHKIVRAIVQILGAKALSLLASKTRERLRAYLAEALGDNDEDILMAALQGLSSIGKADNAAPILNLAVGLDKERQSELYEAAISALAAIGYNDALRDALRGEDASRIQAAMDACRLIHDRQSVEDLKQVFWRGSQEIKRAAMTEIVQLGDCTDTPFFMAAMEEFEDAEILKSALAFFGNQHACPEVENMIFSQLDHRYVDVKEMALEACINLHSATLNERFKERAGSEDPMQRMMAVYALGRYSVQENLPRIAAALEDPSPKVRQMAVEAFQNLGPEAAAFVPQLLPRLADDDKDVRLTVVDLLGQIGTPEVMPHIMDVLDDANEWVRIRAIEALGRYRAVDAVPALAQMLEHASPMSAFKIIEALGHIGGAAAFSVLLGMMDHEDQEIQHAAAEAVGAIQAQQQE